MTQVAITKTDARWEARFPFNFEVKERFREAGWKWDPTNKCWWTTDPMAAARMDAGVANTLNHAIASSFAQDAALHIPVPPGLAYLPYQKAGIAYASARAATLIADEMGLGKTIQAIGVINLDPSIKRVLIVCPATPKPNWLRELRKWLTREFTIEIANGAFPRSDIVIINYDILVKHREAIDAVQWDLLIVDEAHYAKNPKAQRTQALLGKRERGRLVKPGIAARRRIFLTGTPIVNRPAELWTLVEALDPNGMGSHFFRFMSRYTEAHHNGYGWDFTGAANLEELGQRLRSSIMIRRLKSDVMRELPAKRRQVVMVSPASVTDIATVERDRATLAQYRATLDAAEAAVAAARALGDRDGYAAAVRKLHSVNRWAFEEMSDIRHKTAVAKIPYVIEHLKDCLEAEDKVVVFCHHHDVSRALKEAFPTAAVVTGETKQSERLAEVDRFQTDPDCHLFIGGIMAAGVALTLTAAQLVVFAELDWVPGNVSQAEDRLHRIGQQGSVLVQHLVFDNSIDAYLAETIVAKQEVITGVVDSRTQVAVPQPVVIPQPVVAPPRSTAARFHNLPVDDEVIPF